MRRFRMIGTRCSEMPPCERNGNSSCDRSCLRLAGPEDDAALGDDHQVADAVGRQFEACCGLGPGQHDFDADQASQPRRDIVDHIAGKVNGRKRAQRSVVDDIGVRDRQDHPSALTPEPFVEQVLQEDHVRARVQPRLGVHAVVCGHADHRTERVQSGQVPVHHRVEAVGVRIAGRVLVLHVVGGREVHHVGLAGFEQSHAGGKDELGQLGAVDVRDGHADQRQDVVDAVFLFADLVRLLGREADSLHAVARAAF